MKSNFFKLLCLFYISHFPILSFALEKMESSGVEYILLDGSEEDSKAHQLFDKAKKTFTLSFLKAYEELSLATLGWGGDLDDAKEVKERILSNVVAGDQALYAELKKTKNFNNYAFVFALREGQVVGYRSLQSIDGKVLYSRQGAVHPKHQRQGISTQLFNMHVKKWPNIEKAYVCTRILNPKSFHFWEKMGFEPCGMQEINKAANTNYSADHYKGYCKNMRKDRTA